MRLTIFLFFWTAFVRAEDATLKEMSGLIASCIARKDTSHAVFHGCFDWHSAVHGHWALFRIALAEKEVTAEARRAEAALTDEGIRLVREALKSSFTFENPYGRAWFLQLAVDFERWAEANGISRPERLRPLALEVAESLLEVYESTEPTPLSHEYNNASWAFYQLHAFFTFAQDSARLAVVRGIISTAFVTPETEVSFGGDKNEFFSVFGNWVYLVAKTQTPATLDAFLRNHPIESSHLPPVVPSSNHSLGLNWSRALALRTLARHVSEQSERARFAKAYNDHVKRAMSDHWLHRNDYRAYGHWVPQFAVYALTEGT